MQSGASAAPDSQQAAQTAREVLVLWWLWLVRGVLAILFGVAAWVWPGLTLASLIWIIGAYLAIDGLISIIGFFRHRALSWGRRTLLLIWGLAEIAAGIALWFAPEVGVVTLMVIFGVWAMLTGMFLLVGAFTTDGHLMSPWLQGVVGILGVLVGTFLVIEPGRGALATLWAIGATAILYGVFLILAAYRVRSLRDAVVQGSATVPVR